MHLFVQTLRVENSALGQVVHLNRRIQFSDMAASTDPGKIGSKINHDDPIK